MKLRALAILRESIRSIRNYGLTHFLGQTREKIRKREWYVYSQSESSDVAIMARNYDFSSEDVIASNATLSSNTGTIDIKGINWFVPPFDNVFWGGIHTILRFASYYRLNKDVTNRLIVVGRADPEKIRKEINRAFPEAADEIQVVGSYADLDRIPYADATVCTLWPTAYFALPFNKTKRKFYLVQDFEPMFYPAGSTYAQAEATYKLGFLGIANTEPLAEAYRTYGGTAEYFNPCVDTNIFHPLEVQSSERPFTVFFYGRPGHPRNCFELGAEALKRVKKELGDGIRIVSAGSNWDPDEHGLEGMVESLGVLSYSDTANLYRNCDVGLSMSVTMHPSYIPLQLMASECLVVSNQNLSTGWFLKDNVNCILSEASPRSLSEAVLNAANDISGRSRITKNALEMVTREYSNWTPEMEKVYAFMISGQAAKPRRPSAKDS